MRTINYNRTPILSWCELLEEQRKQVLSNYFDSEEEAEEEGFILYQDGPLPLCMFMRSENGKFGIYGLTYFSAYFFYPAKSGDGGIVAYKVS